MVQSTIVYFVSLLVAAAITVNGAELTTATSIGPGASDPLATAPTPTTTPIININVSPTAVSPCQQLQISWTVTGTSDLSGTDLTLSYTNGGLNQTGSSIVYNPRPQSGDIAIQPLNHSPFAWTVFLAEPGYYAVTASTASRSRFVISQSAPFLVTGDASCMSSSSTSPIPTGSDGSTSNTASQPASSDPGTSSTSSSPKVGSIVGGTIAAVVILGLIVAFLLCRRRRKVIAKNVNQRAVAAGSKGHRKWGGLASIDKLEGEIPVVMPSSSPYGNQDYNRTRSQSTGRAMTDEEGLEKGYGKDRFPVDADLLSEMPSLSNRASRRYSSDAVSAVLRQSSGLAAFNDEHSRKRGPTPAAPVLSTTTATAEGGDDPFSDATFFARGNRSSALSVPSTARAPSRVSDISRHTPSPLPPATTTPVQSQPPSQANTMTRNASATASMGRPSRKPVPQYSDNSIELSHTSRSSPTSQTFPSRSGSGPMINSSVGDLSSSMTSYDALASSADSQSHWLRAPVANRQIGLAGQGEGPVHYLMPDLPPPAR